MSTFKAFSGDDILYSNGIKLSKKNSTLIEIRTVHKIMNKMINFKEKRTSVLK
jgi:hypothetical protein